MKSAHSDQEIINGLQAGGASRERYARILYQTYIKFIFAGVKRYKISEELAQDAYADAVVKVCAHIEQDKFRQDSKLSSYLFQAFSNRCVDKLRSTTSYVFEEDITAFYDLPTRGQGILQQLSISDDLAKLEQLMDTLGKNCKRLLIDTEYYGYSLKEVAEKLGFNKAATAANMKYRCLKQLRELLGLTNKQQ